MDLLPRFLGKLDLWVPISSVCWSTSIFQRLMLRRQVYYHWLYNAPRTILVPCLMSDRRHYRHTRSSDAHTRSWSPQARLFHPPSYQGSPPFASYGILDRDGSLGHDILVSRKHERNCKWHPRSWPSPGEDIYNIGEGAGRGFVFCSPIYGARAWPYSCKDP